MSLARCSLYTSSRPRPTHDQIEQLQSKVNDLEDLLRAVSGAESATVNEALQSWRQSGSTNATAGSSRRPASNATANVPASDEGNEDTGAAFETPPGDQYIYDTTG